MTTKASALTQMMMNKAGAPPGNAAAAALAKLQSTTPEQHAEKIKGIKDEAAVMVAFMTTDGPVAQAAVPENFSALLGRGLLKLDGPNIVLTELGKNVRNILYPPQAASATTATPATTAAPAAAPSTPPSAPPQAPAKGSIAAALLRGLSKPAAPPQPTLVEKLRALSPQLTKSYDGGVEAVEAIAQEIGALLTAPNDGSVDEETRSVFVGMRDAAVAWMERQVAEAEATGEDEDPPEVVIDLSQMQTLFIENEDGTGLKVADWWTKHVGGDVTSAVITGKMAMGEGVAFQVESGIVLIVSPEMSGVVCPPALASKYDVPLSVRPAEAGAPVVVPNQGSAVNAPDGVAPDAPDAEAAPAASPPKGPVLPDGRNARKLNKKDLVEAHGTIFTDDIEGGPAIKVYRANSKLPAKGRVIEDLIKDLELMLALRQATIDGSDLQAAVQALNEAATVEAIQEATGPVTTAPTTTATPTTTVTTTAAPTTPITTTAAPTTPITTTAAPTTPITTTAKSVMAATQMPRVSSSFTLYLNCRPMRGSVVDLADFLRPFEDAVADESQLADYLGKPWKEGQKALVLKLAIAQNRGELELPAALYCSRHHPAFDEVTTYLKRYAHEVVQPCS